MITKCVLCDIMQQYEYNNMRICLLFAAVDGLIIFYCMII